MALTDSENLKKRKRGRPKGLAKGTIHWYSDKQKMDLITTWMTTGNLALACRLHSIPEVTARVWKASDWWQQVVADLKMQEKIELSSTMKALVKASQDIVAQRLANGDPILNQKTGEIVMKPVSMKDAHKVAVDLIDRRAIVEKTTHLVEVNEERTDDKLEKLAEKFAEMSIKSIEKNINKRRTIDVEGITDAYERTMGENERGREDPLQIDHEETSTRES